MKTIVPAGALAALLIFTFARPASGQRIASEAVHARADTIPVDSLLVWHQRQIEAGDDANSAFTVLLKDYVTDPQSSRGDSVFNAFLEIAETSDELRLLSPTVTDLMRGEAALPGERTATLVNLFQGVVGQDPPSKLRMLFLSRAQYASPQFRRVAAGWISGALARGEVADETDTEILVGRLGDLGEPGISALRRLIENEQIPPMFGGLHRAREMLQRAIERQGGGGSG